ncbi:MAG: ATP-binding cassette domain-containing protein, partial [Devosia sp.]|nr:ATP-binding cassette domain-containing protein [Devosia sp.]
LYRNAGILILDEPTAVLTQPEAEKLFATLRTMTAEGLSLIFISHKLAEVMTAADRVVVLRGGKVVAERKTAETDRAELAELMVGRRVTRPVREHQQPGAPLLICSDVSVVENGQRRLDQANFTVHAGEILGIIGVAGNGQTTLGRLVAGLVSPTSGTLQFAGGDIGHLGPRALIEKGFGRIPEDRHAEGVVDEMAVWENAVLERLHEPRFSGRGLVNRPAARAFATELITRFDIRGATPETGTRLLSGGNMQKLILGRNLAGNPRLLLANQPTRGLDEGAIAAVHAELLAARKAGAGIILISEDLDEVLRIADRVQAIFKGRLSGARGVDRVKAGTIGLMMAGIWEADDAA